MPRAHKLILALAIAVVVHLAILLLSLAPPRARTAATAASSEQAIEIGWAATPPDAEQVLSQQREAIEAIKHFQLTPPLPTMGEAAEASPAALSVNREYASFVRQHLARFAGALPAGAAGEARVQFVVQLDGRVSEVFLVKRSGNAGLDAVALSLPVKAQPLPLPGARPQRLEVPVQAIAASAAP